MAKGTWIALGVLGAIVLLVLGVVGAGVGTYNGFVKETEAIDAQSKQVDVAYQLAFRLVPQLTNLTLTYMQNEADVITQATALRSGLASAGNGTFEAKDDYLNEFVSFVALVGNRVENYPELEADDLFRDTMAQIVTAETKVAMEKVRYNDRVQAYNQHRRECCIPLFVGGAFGFEAREYIGFEDRPNQVPFPEGQQL
jgi:LemA protein